MVVSSIKSLMENILVRVVHSLRKGNTLVNFFINLVFDFTGNFEYNNIEQVLLEGRNIINFENVHTLMIIEWLESDLSLQMSSYDIGQVPRLLWYMEPRLFPIGHD